VVADPMRNTGLLARATLASEECSLGPERLWCGMILRWVNGVG